MIDESFLTIEDYRNMLKEKDEKIKLLREELLASKSVAKFLANEKNNIFNKKYVFENVLDHTGLVFFLVNLSNNDEHEIKTIIESLYFHKPSNSSLFAYKIIKTFESSFIKGEDDEYLFYIVECIKENVNRGKLNGSLKPEHIEMMRWVASDQDYQPESKSKLASSPWLDLSDFERIDIINKGEQ
ncbi:hypothetical protein [Marinobacter salarius]|uniref:hypothetical protein n=1 Tax=Marinobacter salarius TaxID=1420917 RepID=UPI003BABAE93